MQTLPPLPAHLQKARTTKTHTYEGFGKDRHPVTIVTRKAITWNSNFYPGLQYKEHNWLPHQIEANPYRTALRNTVSIKAARKRILARQREERRSRAFIQKAKWQKNRAAQQLAAEYAAQAPLRRQAARIRRNRAAALKRLQITKQIKAEKAYKDRQRRLFETGSAARFYKDQAMREAKTFGQLKQATYGISFVHGNKPYAALPNSRKTRSTAEQRIMQKLSNIGSPTPILQPPSRLLNHFTGADIARYRKQFKILGKMYPTFHAWLSQTMGLPPDITNTLALSGISLTDQSIADLINSANDQISGNFNDIKNTLSNFMPTQEPTQPPEPKQHWTQKINTQNNPNVHKHWLEIQRLEQARQARIQQSQPTAVHQEL